MPPSDPGAKDANVDVRVLERQVLTAASQSRRRVSHARVEADEALQAYLEQEREGGRVDEEDTGVHRLDSGIQQRAYERKLKESGRRAAETLAAEGGANTTGPITMRPQHLVSQLGAGRDEHVVVVDRDPAVVAELRKVLEGEGYRVRSADNGIDGLARVLRGADRPDVLFIDMALPELSGVGVLAALRETDMAEMPYVVLVDGAPCGHDRDADIDHAHREHIDPEAVLLAARVKIGERRAQGR